MSNKKQSNQDLKGKLKKNQNNSGSSGKQERKDTAVSLVEKMKPQIEKALPQHIGLERFTRIALTTIRQNPQLLNCDKSSLLGSIMQAAQLGLEPNMLGSCYIIPFKDNKKGITEATFILGYRGMIDLVRRSGNIKSIYAHEVRENDEFDYEYGLDPNLKHKPAMKDRGNLIGFYAVAHFKDGGYQFEFMPIEEIEKRRMRSAAARSKSSPWHSDYEEMGKKTVIRHMFKYLPLSVEREMFQKHEFDMDKDERPYKVDDETGEIYDVDYEIGEDEAYPSDHRKEQPQEKSEASSEESGNQDEPSQQDLEEAAQYVDSQVEGK